MLLDQRLRAGDRDRSRRHAVRSSGLLAAALAAASAVCAVPTVAQEAMDLDLLVERGGVYLEPGAFRPYSGAVARMWVPDAVRERGVLDEGRWTGVREWFHPNGRLSGRETWRNGVLHGPAEMYFKSGLLSMRENYANGELDGPYESYWTRGALAERGAWRSGRPCGEWTSFGRSVVFPSCARPRYR